MDHRRAASCALTIGTDVGGRASTQKRNKKGKGTKGPRRRAEKGSNEEGVALGGESG